MGLRNFRGGGEQFSGGGGGGLRNFRGEGGDNFLGRGWEFFGKG